MADLLSTSTSPTGAKDASPRAAAPRVLMVQDGARLHYAVPVALQRAGMLDSMFSEWFIRGGSWQAAVARLASAIRPAVGRKVAGRTHPELGGAQVVQNLPLLVRQLRQRKKMQGVEYYAWASAQVGRWVRSHGFGQANMMLGFVRNIDPGLLRAGQEAGLATVVDQCCAAAPIYDQEVRLQHERWPGWESSPDLQHMPMVADIERRSWASADRLLCPSDYVRQGLIAQGVAADKISLLHYPIDASDFPPTDRRGRSGPVTVGFVGAVNLGKGIPYLLEVARKFDPKRVRFVVVGGVHLRAEMLEKQRGPAEIIGPVPRSQVLSWLHKFDLFFFPSTCEGSAGAVMEAMSAGLPIVTSPNSGAIIRDGQEGYVLPYDDVEGFTRRIRELVENAGLRLAMGQAAHQRSRMFDLDWYSSELARILPAVLAQRR